MPVAFIQEFPLDEGGDRSTANYDEVSRRLNPMADPPAGLILHTAGFDEEAGVFRIFNVWETEEAGRRFEAERVMPIVMDLAGSGGDGSNAAARALLRAPRGYELSAAASTAALLSRSRSSCGPSSSSHGVPLARARSRIALVHPVPLVVELTDPVVSPRHVEPADEEQVVGPSDEIVERRASARRGTPRGTAPS